MKKLILVLAFLLILTIGAFAEHPGGGGIGIVGQSHFEWKEFKGSPGAALSLKMPEKPVYWGINVRLNGSDFWVSVTGDNYIVDKRLLPDINLGWYLGVGAYAGFFHVGGDSSYSSLGGGARVPIGIYVFPMSFFEVYVDVAPSLGLEILFGNKSGPYFPAGGLGADLGIRFWL